MKTLFTALAVLSLLFCSPSLNAQLAGAGNAYDFNFNYVYAPDAPSLNVQYVTLEAWIKADSWAPNIWQNVIISKDGWAGGEQGYTLRAGANGSLSFNIGPVGAPWQEVTTGPVMNTGQWYHVAASYDGSVMRIYINGEELNTNNYTGLIDNYPYDLTIGRIAYTAGGTRDFDGTIDEVRVWNAALPASSIQEYMCKKVIATHPQFANLVGYWNMDGPTPIDNSPNGNNGINVGATQVASGAAIGNESIFTYGSPVDLTLPYMGIDSLQVVTVDAVNTVHVYRIDEAPLNAALSPGIDSVDQTHHYGVFADGANYTLDVTYHYGSNPLNGGQYYELIGRTDGTVSPWTVQNATLDQLASTLDQSYTSRHEFILGISCPQLNMNLSGAQSLCAGETILLEDQSTSTFGWQWHDASGPIAGATNASYTVTATGDYYVVVNDGACLDSNNAINVTINDLPVVSFGNLGTDHCENDLAITIPSGTPAGGGYSGNGVVAGNFDPSIAGIGTHMLYYNYADLSTGCSNSDSMEVNVYAAPTPPVIAVNGGDLCIPSGEIGSTYEWYLDGNVILTAFDTCYTPTTNGDYEVVCTNSNGCSATSTAVTVNDVSLIEKYLSQSVIVSPNPTMDNVQIVLPELKENVRLTLTDAHGKVMETYMISGTSSMLDLSDSAPGVYMLTFESERESVTKRIVKH